MISIFFLLHQKAYLLQMDMTVPYLAYATKKHAPSFPCISIQFQISILIPTFVVQCMWTIVTYCPVFSSCGNNILEQLKIHICHNLYSAIISLKGWNNIIMLKFAFDVLP